MKFHTNLDNRASTGTEFLGWRSLPNEILDIILALTGRLRKVAKLVVVIGVEGSYFGVKAVQDALYLYFKKIRRP